MKKSVHTFILLFCVFCSSAQEESKVDSVLIYESITDFIDQNKEGTILRTYDVHFSKYNLRLDTADECTIKTLNTIGVYLISNNKLKIEVGTHLSTKFWSGDFKNYDYMPDEIIHYLINIGVDENQLKGKNYFNYYPILKLSDKKKFKNEDEFFDKEWGINNRVEFKIIFSE